MGTYILLRNNRQIGPLTFRELKTQPLYNTDLIWIEGESTSWSAAAEVAGLSGSITEAQPVAEKRSAVTQAPLSEVLLTPHFATKPAAVSAPAYPSLAEVDAPEPEPIRWKPRRTGIATNKNMLNVPILFAGLVLTAFMVKKMVDEFGTPPAVTDAQAYELSEERTPAGAGAHAAYVAPSANTNVVGSIALPASDSLDKATVKLKKPTVKTAVNDTASGKPVASNAIAANHETPTAHNLTATEPTVDKSDKAGTPPTLKLSANAYKVGFLGGVSDVQLTVSNPSGQQVDNAFIAVDYLKPNGSIVKTENVFAGRITAGGEVTVAVPASSRGVKIAYRVLSVAAATN